ncbi:hypothetical protein [Sphingomonas sp. Ant H11]|uniref:hypothetical protein n=1 Tax=Sphingomonas sp. Ant H11 TaxID=1564113 RepID=UPI000B06115C|nr:hypothetical protein [Sphingomonas sp. Ant H11]
MPDIVAIPVGLGLSLDLILLFGLAMFGLYLWCRAERESGWVLPFLCDVPSK